MTPQFARVLVTGGAGVIGSHLTDVLIERGSQVTVFDDLSTGHSRNLAQHEGNTKLRLVRGSVLDPAALTALVPQHDIVYHLAAVVGVRYVVDDPLNSVLVNVRGTENVLAAAFRERTPVLLASTSEVYGKGGSQAFAEDDDRVLGPTRIHRWSYSSAKAIDEHLAFAYADRGLPVSIVRYFNAYGPRIDERGYGSVIARFAAQALAGQPITVHGDGAQTRCFTYVADTVRGTILAAETPQARGMVLNIGSTEEVSIGQLASLIKTGLDSTSTIVNVPYEVAYGRSFEDTRRRVPNMERANEVLGFRAEVRLQDGLARTLEWCRRNYAGSRSVGIG
jgi:UDP-glucose 4-epimerase